VWSDSPQTSFFWVMSAETYFGQLLCTLQMEVKPPFTVIQHSPLEAALVNHFKRIL
jgi:hypothetical protein